MTNHYSRIANIDHATLAAVDVLRSCEMDYLVMGMSAATYWHALRAVGITDRKAGFGALMEHH